MVSHANMQPSGMLCIKVKEMCSFLMLFIKLESHSMPSFKSLASDKCSVSLINEPFCNTTRVIFMARKLSSEVHPSALTMSFIRANSMFTSVMSSVFLSLMDKKSAPFFMPAISAGLFLRTSFTYGLIGNEKNYHI